jgi:hypothetical protein
VEIQELVLGAAFVALLIFGALSVAFVLTTILASHRIRVGTQRTPAEQKALTLLREWLSPAQRARFESYGHFEVKGSRTGKRYRIRADRVVNIDELDARGAQVASWCFAPEGNLPMGDIMLAQKIALESDEDAVLAIAIRHLDPRPPFARRY